MLLKWIGGLCIVISCGSVGFRIAASQRKEEKCLAALISSLDFMMCELQYRLTPLPDLCRKTAQSTAGVLKQFFITLAHELEDQISPNVEICMRAAICKCSQFPETTKECLLSLGKTMGRFDIEGQIKGLDAARKDCMRYLQNMQKNKEQRLRSYQTLGICAGAALAILFV